MTESELVVSVKVKDETMLHIVLIARPAKTRTDTCNVGVSCNHDAYFQQRGTCQIGASSIDTLLKSAHLSKVKRFTSLVCATWLEQV